jgi:hypothetical protein
MEANFKLKHVPKDLPITNVLPNVPYQSLIGCLMYIAVTIHPDIAHVTGVLSQFDSCYTEEHWKHAEHVLRYLKGTIDYNQDNNYCLVYKHIDNVDASFVVYVDAV